MLYDHKRWDKPEIKADPFSLESLIAWLEAQPTDRIYCFENWGECLLGQWLKSIDDSSHQINGENGYVYSVNGAAVDTSDFKLIAYDHPRTFGAALFRARKALVA